MNQSTLGQPVTFTARVTPAGANGKVTFFDGATQIGTKPVVNGEALLITRLLPSGVRSIRATYVGDVTYAPVRPP